MMYSEYFSKTALKSTNRVLNLLDRNSFSKTFGCFDKYYWHFKTKDFPSASYQMGVEFLSRLWNLPHGDFYKNPQLLNWIKASMEYTCSLQHKDGSFDEWYPNERGWAGPTSYITHSLINAYQIMENQLDEKLKTKMQDCFLRAHQFLIRQREGAVLANHFALFLLSLYEIFHVTQDHKIKSDFESYLKQFNSLVSEEGWSMEYDGADFGYNLATLSFLARLHKMYPDSLLKKYAQKSFYFLSYFLYPDGSFGGLGSRETIHLYPFALKYWGQTIIPAKEMDRYFLRKNSYEKLAPHDQDDHYLFYRLSEYLEADEITDESQPDKAPDLPFLSKSNFQKYFSESGFLIKKLCPFYLVANMKKGGCLRIYNTQTEMCLSKNNGWVIELRNKLKLTNCRISINDKIDISDEKISMAGKSGLLNQRYFNSLKFVIFRIILMIVRNYKMAFYLKKLIRHFLILKKKSSKYFFKRDIYFKNNEIHIIDSINCDRAEKIFYGGGFSVRYVPQSGYFEESDLQNIPYYFIPKNKKIIIKQICYLTNEKTELCVE